MKKIICTLCFAAAFAAAAVNWVQNYQGRAEIVIGKNPAPAERFAAEELRRWVEAITGAALPIVAEPTKSSWWSRIYLGTAFARGYPDDLKFIGKTDGYAVRQNGRDIYIFGTEPKGTLNGVYALLEKNTDIIWARPEPFGNIYSTSPELKITKFDFRDKPKFTERGWQICGSHQHEQTEYWIARTGSNRAATYLFGQEALYNRLIETGSRIYIGGGHNLNRYMPTRKYFEKHPEYFAVVDGKRRPDVAQTQTCFSSKGGAEAVADELIDYVKRERFKGNTYTVYTEDNWNLCDCPDCHKPIELANGKKLTVKDDNFRSTQCFNYLRPAADRLKKEFPGLRIATFAYIFTAPIPDSDIPENMDIVFCPFVRNDKVSLDHPSNRKWRERVTAWSKRTSNIIWREYYGCASKFPRPLGEVVAKDLAAVNKLGLHKVMAEYIPDMKGKSNSDLSWDVSAMEFWVISKLYWNPEQDVKKLRSEYMKRAFREAAPAMEKFYGHIVKSWYDDPAPSSYNESEYKSAVHYIVQKGLEKPCRDALVEAEKLAKHPGSAKLIARIRARFEDWMKQAPLHMTPETTVPYSAQAPSSPDDPVWEKGGKIDGFRVMNRPEIDSKEKTQVRLLHDRRNLYILFACADREPGTLYAIPSDGSERWTKGDHVEIFLDGDAKKSTPYRHFGVDCNGRMYDALGFDNKWNSGAKVAGRIGKEGYRIMAAIPFADLGIELSLDNRIKGHFYRAIHHNRSYEEVEHSSWNGTPVHQQTGFGVLTLNME